MCFEYVQGFHDKLGEMEGHLSVLGAAFGELKVCLTHVPTQLGLNILLDLSAAVATPPVFVFVAGQLLPDAEYKHAVPTAFIANDKA